MLRKILAITKSSMMKSICDTLAQAHFARGLRIIGSQIFAKGFIMHLFNRYHLAHFLIGTHIWITKLIYRIHCLLLPFHLQVFSYKVSMAFLHIFLSQELIGYPLILSYLPWKRGSFGKRRHHIVSFHQVHIHHSGRFLAVSGECSSI